MNNLLKQIVEDSYANALEENNPEIARAIDKIIKNGGTMKRIVDVMEMAQGVTPEKTHPIFFEAIRAYARRALKERDESASIRREIKSDCEWLSD